jgi:hypothetical protein
VPCQTGQALYAVDSYTGGDDADIDLRVFDAGLYEDRLADRGRWGKISGDALAIETGVVVHETAGSPAYTVYAAIEDTLDTRNQAIRQAFTIDHLTASDSEIAVCTHLAPNGDCYRLRAVFSNSAVTYLLEAVLAGYDPQLLASWDPAVDDVPELGVGNHVIGLCAECLGDDDTSLTPTVDGVALGEDISGLGVLLPAGVPGVGVLDQDATASPKGFWLTRTDLIGCRTNAPGDDGSGGGGGGGIIDVFLWGMRLGKYRPAQVPSVDSLTEVQGTRLGIRRQIKKAWAFIRGAWRELRQDDANNGGLNGDPGEAVPDVGCGQVPSGTLPVPPPGDKLFAAWELPFSGSVAPYDTGFNEMGGHTPGRLAEAQASGLRYIGAQGGYKKFRNSSGMYDPDVMDAWIHSFAGLDSLLQSYHAAGVFVGVSVADDIRNTKPLNGWPPSGLSAQEINRICGVWKLQHSWIFTLVRTHPSVLVDMGATPGSMPNLDATISQYASQYGDINRWIAREESLRAQIGIPYNLWSLNYYEGDGRSNVRTEVREEIVRPRYFMSAEEILEYGTPMALSFNSLGIAGWKINMVFLNQPGLVDALIQVKTLMLATP